MSVGTRQFRRSGKHRLLAPFARFFGWWAGLFAFLAAFSVCPFCGQAGCAGGPVFAGVLGGISAFFMSVLRLGRRQRKDAHVGRQHDHDHADQNKKKHEHGENLIIPPGESRVPR